MLVVFVLRLLVVVLLMAQLCWVRSVTGGVVDVGGCTGGVIGVAVVVRIYVVYADIGCVVAGGRTRMRVYIDDGVNGDGVTVVVCGFVVGVVVNCGIAIAAGCCVVVIEICGICGIVGCCV